MGCFTLGASRVGEIKIGGKRSQEMTIGASMICTITVDDRVYLKDSLGNYLRDALGRFLAAPKHRNNQNG